MTCFAVVFEDSCWVLVDRWYCRPNSRLRQFRRWSEQAHGHGLEVLNDGGEMELVAGAGKAAQPHAFESMMRLQVGKAHLDPLPLIARFQEGLRLHLAASDVAAASLTSRTIRREGMFGQHLCFSGHSRQRGTDAKYRIAWSLWTRPLVVSVAPAGQM